MSDKHLEPNNSNPHYNDHHSNKTKPGNKPLSGSKKVKNQNHSRTNHGEGS